MYDEQLPFYVPNTSSTPNSSWRVPTPQTRTAEEQFQFDLQCQREHFRLELLRAKDDHERAMRILRMASHFTKLLFLALMVYLIAGMVSDVRCVLAPEAKAVIKTTPAIDAAPGTEQFWSNLTEEQIALPNREYDAIVARLSENRKARRQARCQRWSSYKIAHTPATPSPTQNH